MHLANELALKYIKDKGDKIYDKEASGNLNISHVDELKAKLKEVFRSLLAHFQFYTEFGSSTRNSLYSFTEARTRGSFVLYSTSLQHHKTLTSSSALSCSHLTVNILIIYFLFILSLPFRPR
jgi:hypothetical protein